MTKTSKTTNNRINNNNTDIPYNVLNYDNVGYETNQLLSQNIKVTFNTWKTHLGSMNTLVIGATGEGKSRYIVRPIMYSLPRDPRTKRLMSFVATDPKGELCRDIAGFLAANGYTIKVLNLVDMFNSDCYNPLKYVNFNTNPEMAITTFINGLVDAATGGDNSKDPYWGNMAKNVLNCLAFYVYYELPAEKQNLSTISDMITLFQMADDDIEAPIDPILRNCKAMPLEVHPAMKYRNKIQARGKELTSILGTTNSALQLWADSGIRRLTEVDTINLHEIGDRPTALFVITPASNSTYDFLVGTFYDQLIETLMFKANVILKTELPHHVILVQDEFANTGKVNDYHKKIAVWRSVNISSIIIVQAPNQIKTMYEGKAQDIIDNVHITIFLGNGGNSIDSNGSSAADFMSRALGKTTVKSESYSMNYSKNDIKPIINSSIGNVQRDLMTADEVKRLAWDECLILIKGYKPFIDKKIDLNSCLNFGSDLFSTADKNGNRKLKKEFNYVIEERKQTLDSFFEGKKYLNEIDKIQFNTLKRTIVTNALFSSFEKDKNSVFIKNELFIGIDNIADMFCENYMYYTAEDMYKRFKKDKDSFSCYINDEYIDLENCDNTPIEDTINNNNNKIIYTPAKVLSEEEEKNMKEFINTSKKAIEEAKKGDISKCKELVDELVGA